MEIVKWFDADGKPHEYCQACDLETVNAPVLVGQESGAVHYEGCPLSPRTVI